MMGCTEEQKVSYSAFLLKDCAKDWWKAHQRVSYGRSSRGNFQRDAKVEEFYRLEQGDFSVPEYEKKFSELIRLVPFFKENE